MLNEINKNNYVTSIKMYENGKYREKHGTWLDKYISRDTHSEINVYNVTADMLCKVSYTEESELNLTVFYLVLPAVLFVGPDIYKLRRKINSEVLIPISQIVDFMDNCNMFEKKEKCSVEGVEEIERLANHVVLMLDAVKQSSRQLCFKQQELYEAELCKQEYLYKMLQNEINPHFMYNTLNCIYGMAVSRDEYDIGEMCSSLSSILQYALEDETMVTVEEVMNIVKQYLSIMKMRFGDNVKYEINIPKAAENKK